MLMNDKIYLSSPHMGGNEVKYVQEAFSSNWIAPLGPHVSGFEDELEKYLNRQNGEKHVAALSSGTAALHLALIMLGINRGDEVICQSFTFSASANPIAYLGAIPVFVDSEKDTWNICPLQLERAIKDRMAKGKKPKAIIAVHLYGMPYQVDAVTAVAEKYDIPIIEDSAEALGSTYKNKACGSFGKFSILSFNGNKIITTSGGGALVTSTESEKKQAVFLATQARDEAPHYQHSQIGYNYRLSNVCAGIGRGQLEVLEQRVENRRKMHRFYKELLAPRKSIEVFSEPTSDYHSNHWLSCITFQEKDGYEKREKLRLALAASNIESRPLWKPLHLQPVFKDAPFYGTGTSEELFRIGLCLPSGSNLIDTDRDRIANVLQSFMEM